VHSAADTHSVRKYVTGSRANSGPTVALELKVPRGGWRKDVQSEGRKRRAAMAALGNNESFVMVLLEFGGDEAARRLCGGR
jgi:hypothetical protein